MEYTEEIRALIAACRELSEAQNMLNEAEEKRQDPNVPAEEKRAAIARAIGRRVVSIRGIRKALEDVDGADRGGDPVPGESSLYVWTCANLGNWEYLHCVAIAASKEDAIASVAGEDARLRDVLRETPPEIYPLNENMAWSYLETIG